MGKGVSGKDIEQRIFLIRGHRVMLSPHLAELYGVKLKALTQAVKRNIERFPEDFLFQLTWEEMRSLRSQFVTLENGKNGTSKRGKYSKYLVYAFTEQGVAMLSSILRSKRAIQVNISIMRTFVKIREFLAAHKELAYKLDQLEKKVGKHDVEIQAIFEAIRKLMEPPPAKKKREIGFHVKP